MNDQDQVIEVIDTGKFQYRIVNNGNGFEAQMKYMVGMNSTKEYRWFPLNEFGYWLEPDAFSFGKLTKHQTFPTLEEARRVVLKARVVNEPLRLVE